MLPLFFQVVLLDSATTAGARLAIPSLATPIGGVIAGVVMSRWGKLTTLVRSGAILMAFGNALVTSLGFQDSTWKYFVYVFPANLGQGIIYPAILFTSLASFDHAGKSKPPPQSDLDMYDSADGGKFIRPRCVCFYSVPHSIVGDCLGRVSHVCHCANYLDYTLAICFTWHTVRK